MSVPTVTRVLDAIDFTELEDQMAIACEGTRENRVHPNSCAWKEEATHFVEVICEKCDCPIVPGKFLGPQCIHLTNQALDAQPWLSNCCNAPITSKHVRARPIKEAAA